jgi:hypothetical protein
MVSTSEHKRFIIESYFRNGVFNNGERCCLFDRVSAKNSKFKLKQVYATKNTSMHSRHLLTYVQTFKGLFDLNSC